MSGKKVLQMYKLLLRESEKFSSYNFREYALRKVRDSFKANRDITDPNLILSKLEEAANNLEIIKRQALIGRLYSTDKLVIEYQNTTK